MIKSVEKLIPLLGHNIAERPSLYLGENTLDLNFVTNNCIWCLSFDLFACIAVTSAGVIMYTNTAVRRINMPNTFQRA